jgi:hypothetical protein
MTELNAVLAYQVLDHIEAHPEQWDQTNWARQVPECGTAGCFAGWTVMLSGMTPLFRESYGGRAMDVIDDRGYQVSVSEAATRLLGARYVYIDTDIYPDDDEEEDLFDESNDLDDLRRLVFEIFGPRPAVMTAS